MIPFLNTGCQCIIGGEGGHYISACTSTRDRGQDLDPANFHV